MVRRPVFRLREVPSWLWGVLALLVVLGIPNPVHTLSLPDQPIFAQVREEALRGVIVQCLGSSLLLIVCVCRRQGEVRAEHRTSNGPQDNVRRFCFQFGIADMLVWITLVAVCLSLWRLSGSWLLALLAGTCAFQADALRHHPSRIKIGTAWAAVWVIVTLMVVMGVG